MKINNLKIKIFSDGANFKEMMSANKNRYIKGLTTNPSLMRKSGISDYTAFAKLILKSIKKKPISFEVFSDDFKEMEKQAKIINGWGKNVYVKIPITNSKGRYSLELIKKLSDQNIKLNITAITTIEQVSKLKKYLNKKATCVISVFAGRIADTGRDPTNYIKQAIKKFKNFKKVEILWASTREVYNIIQANDLGCHIITVPPNLIKKLNLFGKDLKKYSLETVKDFYIDAKKSKFKI